MDVVRNMDPPESKDRGNARVPECANVRAAEGTRQRPPPGDAPRGALRTASANPLESGPA